MSTKTMKEKAAELLQKCEVVTLASVNKEGYPRPVPMSKIAAEVVTDEKLKQELWQDWFIEHFPGGPTDPGYVLLKFTANHATYWIEGTFIHKKLD